MFHRIKNYLRHRLPRRSVIYAFAKAGWSGQKLPPGGRLKIDQTEPTDRNFLLDQAARFGPVFRATIWGEFCVCIVGLPLGRRLLREEADNLGGMTMKLETLFPEGFLRQMEGEVHRKYRQALVSAIQPDDFNSHRLHLRTIAGRSLAEYAGGANGRGDAASAYVAAVNRIASGMLVQTFFGTPPGTAPFDRIMQGYQKLGPNGLVWNPGAPQKEALIEIRDYLLAQFAGAPEQRPANWRHSILGRIVNAGMLDETMLGNLIYMVEMGRYDCYSLFRWLTKFAAENPAMLERIAHENNADLPLEKSFTEAFVSETLRLVQSERLTRIVKRDIQFEGYLLPKHCIIRICLWEAHKSPGSFPDPFQFNPGRFLAHAPDRDQYSPFGLDQHQCPFGDTTLNLGGIFLRSLAGGYTLTPVANGETVRGKHHWEPANQFGVRLQPRTGL